MTLVLYGSMERVGVGSADNKWQNENLLLWIPNEIRALGSYE